jgi:hypothetical protein
VNYNSHHWHSPGFRAKQKSLLLSIAWWAGEEFYKRLAMLTNLRIGQPNRALPPEMGE